MTRLGIAGIGGRMGREIAAVAAGHQRVQLIGGLVAPGTASALAPQWPGLLIVERASELLPEIDVLVDFSTAEAVSGHARASADAGTPYVTGVTGLGQPELAVLTEVSQRIPLFYARNMSVGIAALLAILPTVAGALQGYDAEILELHHRGKQDAPSGTAMALLEALESASQVDASRRVFGRSGISPRQPGEIGIHALRGGGNPGEHLVLFASESEEIRITHRALNRRVFAEGAVRAAEWTAGRPPGLYGMPDLIQTNGESG